MLTCRSAAKINLNLDLLACRPDGYHELQSVVHSIGLWDAITFEFDFGPGFSLRCNEPNLAGDDNLCLKAARAWLAATRAEGLRMRFNGLRITLQKNIPSGAGLGGGSGNAAATLLALNRHFDNALNDAALHTVAATLGADVPFFLHGGCALMEGIGERLTPLPAIEGWLVLIKPPLDLSTPQVYRQWDAMEVAPAPSTAAMREAVLTGDLSQVAAALHNDLSIAAQGLGLEVESLTQVLMEHGALGAKLTGSGSAVFGIFADEEIARAAAAQIDGQFNNSIERSTYKVFTASFCSSAVEFMDAAITTRL
jgi:4-diphosphocytidyl-2-C-methyl-D-erythritol kinase